MLGYLFHCFRVCVNRVLRVHGMCRFASGRGCVSGCVCLLHHVVGFEGLVSRETNSLLLGTFESGQGCVAAKGSLSRTGTVTARGGSRFCLRITKPMHITKCQATVQARAKARTTPTSQLRGQGFHISFRNGASSRMFVWSRCLCCLCLTRLHGDVSARCRMAHWRV